MPASSEKTQESPFLESGLGTRRAAPPAGPVPPPPSGSDRPGITGPAAARPPLGGFIVADSAPATGPAQMRKTDFLRALEADVTSVAEQELTREGRTVRDCPWISYWFAYYQKRDAGHVARALVRYAPDAEGAESLAEAIGAVRRRVQDSIRRSLVSGSVEGAPPGIPTEAFDPSQPQHVPSGEPSRDPILMESPGSNDGAGPSPFAGAGSGRPLETATRARMESAFGTDLGHVRLHTGAGGQTLAGRHQTRAVAMGRDIAFAPGQHRPGTVAGDALLAHELAHVLQQRPAGATSPVAPDGANGPDLRSGTPVPSLEADADRSAAGVAALLWTGAGGTPFDDAIQGMPTLTSGPRLSRCGGPPELDADTSVGPQKTVDVKPVRLAGSDRSITEDVEFANTRVFPQANLALNQLPTDTLNEADSQALIGSDLEVEGVSGSTSAEQTTLLNRFATSAHALAVYVDSISPPGSCDRDSVAGYMHPTSASTDRLLVMEDGAEKQAFSHEIGHLLGLPHRSGSGNLMHPYEGSGNVGLNASEIATIRSSSFAT